MRRDVLIALLSDCCAELSLIDWWPLRIPLIAAGVVVLVLLLWRARRAATRLALGSLVIVLVVVNVLLSVNAHYGYFLTAGQAFGFGPADRGSLELLRNRRVRPADGVVVAIDIPGRESQFAARTARVYVPPAWFDHPRPKLPVIELLHGTPGDPDDWVDSARAKVTADRFAAAHGGLAPVIVMPDVNGYAFGDTECVDSIRGRAETYLTRDVPSFVRSRFFTRETGPGWAVAGLSEGGSCAVMLALRHPDLYSAFGDYGGLDGPRSGTVNDPADTAEVFFDGSPQQFADHEPASLLQRRRFPGMRGFFGDGGDDQQPLESMRRLSELSRRAGIGTRVQVLPGREHTFDVWRDVLASSFPWLAEPWLAEQSAPRVPPGRPSADSRVESGLPIR